MTSVGFRNPCLPEKRYLDEPAKPFIDLMQVNYSRFQTVTTRVRLIHVYRYELPEAAAHDSMADIAVFHFRIAPFLRQD
jgi:hypothetical protein